MNQGRESGDEDTDSARLTTWMWGTGQSKEPRINLIFCLGQWSTFNKIENTDKTEKNLR